MTSWLNGKGSLWRNVGRCAAVAGLFVLLSAAPASAQQQPTETTVFGNGNVPQAYINGTISLQTYVNGSPVTNWYYQNVPNIFIPVSYTMDSVTFQNRNPVTHRIVIMEYAWQNDSYIELLIADITITHNPQTGAVTASGSGEGVAGNVRLTGYSNPVEAAVTGGSPNSFSLNTTDNIDDMSINGCVEFTGSTLRVCLSTYSPDPQPVPNPPTNDPAQLDADRDNNVDQRWVRAIREMANELTHVMVQQVQMIGVMLDAKNQLEAQRLLGEGRAQAQRDYHPSEQVCAIGTLAQIPTGSRYHVNRNILALNTIMQRRELLSTNMASAWGPFVDMASRLEKFRTVYCDRNDNSGQLAHDSVCTSTDPARRNRDVNYGTLIDRARTLDVDFTDNQTTATEEDIIALGKNLYSHRTFTQIPETIINDPYSGQAAWELIMDTRMIAAVRSVARHSFTSIVGMKARGTGTAAPQLRTIMENLGLTGTDYEALIGANPSYFAQMDLITQAAFQDPSFFIGLYESPVNVARQGVAMQALRLITDQDKLEHALRREMVLSMFLEMKLRSYQDAITNRVISDR